MISGEQIKNYEQNSFLHEFWCGFARNPLLVDFLGQFILMKCDGEECIYIDIDIYLYIDTGEGGKEMVQ